MYVRFTKGQLTSKGNFGAFKSIKKNKKIARISALASKMGQIKKKCRLLC